uniref:Gnk2-homologous domain-containing protein n=1 Tax=Opuntia streptacantha TaxID=393608 RepID=A0A7C8ZNH2_OPUST
MASSHHLVVASVVLLLMATCSSAYEGPLGYYCNKNSGMADGGPVAANINNLLAGWTQVFKGGARFIASSYGTGENIVYGLAQCREDVDDKDCSECIEVATQRIRDSCPDKPDAQIWYNSCLLTYSPDKFFGNFDTSNRVFTVPNYKDVDDPQALREALRILFALLIGDAIDANNRGFATGQVRLSESNTLHGMAQCTLDLSSSACAQCLDVATKHFEMYCGHSIGCRVFYSSCAVRYELGPFIHLLDGFHKIPGQAMEKSIIDRENKSSSLGRETL